MVLLQYWFYLIIISLAFVVIERLWPWRNQELLRPAILTDLLHLAFNGHFLALALAPAVAAITPTVDALVIPVLGRAHLGGSPIWVQVLVAFFLIDFIKWCVHVTLHHVPFLWTFHKVHHSIVHMDWIGSMRFHWMEIVIYNGTLYIPGLLLGLDGRVLLGMAIFSTIMGHFNHANLRINVGPLRYLLNHPEMHIWHHDYTLHFRAGCNFGINLSCWDWIFGTVYLPEHLDQPFRLGFKGIATFPKNFLTHHLEPFSSLFTPPGR